MTIIDDLKAIESEAAKGIGGVGDLAELDRIRVAVTGKKGSLTGVLRQMGQLDPADRPRVGKLANEVRARIEASLEQRRHELEHAALEARIAADSVDVTLPGRVPNVGSEHLISQIIEEIEQIFCGMGYTVEDGPYIETSYYNFTALNAPLDHPSRSAATRSTSRTTTPAASSTPRPTPTASQTSCCAPRPPASRRTRWRATSRPST